MVQTTAFLTPRYRRATWNHGWYILNYWLCSKYIMLSDSYLLNGLLLHHNSCTIFKHVHCHVISDFGMGPSILHTFLQPGRRRLDDIFASEELWGSVSDLSFQFVLCSWFWWVNFVFCSAPPKMNFMYSIPWYIIQSFCCCNQQIHTVVILKW